jgi:hypothetical protein
MTGMGESTASGIASPYALSSTGLPNYSMTLDATYNAMQAQSTVYDMANMDPVVSNLLLTFGGTSDSGGESAFVDNARFGAHRNQNNENIRMRTDAGQDLANKTGDNAGSYLLSGRAAPIAGYELCTACDFIDWGWWGTRVRIDASGTEIPNERGEFVHMGTWVAGDIANRVDLPTSGSATYNGSALGTVSRDTGSGVAKYIARGDVNMSFDFDTRQGNLTIGNFDGLSATGTVAGNPDQAKALFGGSLSGTSVSGSVNGAFVNNGSDVAAGIIGDFGLSGTGVQAVGTIAGVRAGP